MSSGKDTRHFHAGKLRKSVGGVEFVGVAESNGKVFVGRNGLVTTPRRQAPWRGTRNNLGYYHVGVHTRALKLDMSVHRLVYEVFVGELKGEIDHVNRDPSDNRLENLRDVTHRENIIDNPMTRELHRKAGSKNARRAIELNKVPVVATDRAGHRIEFPSLKEGARVTGANRCSISQVLHGFLKTAGGYKWEVLHG